MLNIDDLAKISRFFELLSAQVSYPDFRVRKILSALQACVGILFAKIDHNRGTSVRINRVGGVDFARAMQTFTSLMKPTSPLY